jgi:hypothetical protein
MKEGSGSFLKKGTKKLFPVCAGASRSGTGPKGESSLSSEKEESSF